MISARAGRRALLVIVLFAFACAFATLAFVGRQGAVSGDVARTIIARLLRLYVPLLALMASFYFSDRGRSGRGRGTSPETYWFALVILVVWTFLPVVLLAFSDTVEAAVRTLDTFEVFGNTLAVASIGFYFAKSASNTPD